MNPRYRVVESSSVCTDCGVGEFVIERFDAEFLTVNGPGAYLVVAYFGELEFAKRVAKLLNESDTDV